MTREIDEMYFLFNFSPTLKLDSTLRKEKKERKVIEEFSFHRQNFHFITVLFVHTNILPLPLEYVA